MNRVAGQKKMAFEIEGKVALVTGAASGIGLHYTMELLRNGVKAVTLADVNPDVGKEVLQKIQKEFGKNKAIFIKTDVSSYHEFEDAFILTVEQFGNIDILVNNAGINNDREWQKEVAINMNGTIHGMLLGFDKYLPKYKKGPEAVIINTSSITGIGAMPSVPIYSATKFAIAGLTLAWGSPYHYNRANVRVVAICPGATTTPLLTDASGRYLDDVYEKMLENIDLSKFTQEPEHVAKEAVKIIQSGTNGSLWVIEYSQPAYEYVLPTRESMKEK